MKELWKTEQIGRNIVTYYAPHFGGAKRGGNPFFLKWLGRKSPRLALNGKKVLKLIRKKPKFEIEDSQPQVKAVEFG
ncbi:hypothetical protein HY993_04870, partial [Candidatus Micrarchaeota archaeon]|nr:hypothetical protein [Candidatus Micrarchaeota archaeon]